MIILDEVFALLAGIDWTDDAVFGQGHRLIRRIGRCKGGKTMLKVV